MDTKTSGLALSWHPCFSPLRLFLGFNVFWIPLVSLLFLCHHFFSILIAAFCSFLCRFFPKFDTFPLAILPNLFDKSSLLSLSVYSSVTFQYTYICVYAYIHICEYMSVFCFLFSVIKLFNLEIFIGLRKQCILPIAIILYFIKEFSNIRRPILCYAQILRIIHRYNFFKGRTGIFHPQSFLFIIPSYSPCQFSFSSLSCHWIIFYFPHGLLLSPFISFHMNINLMYLFNTLVFYYRIRKCDNQSC